MIQIQTHFSIKQTVIVALQTVIAEVTEPLIPIQAFYIRRYK